MHKQTLMLNLQLDTGIPWYSFPRLGPI